jgi:hypothetical protein
MIRKGKRWNPRDIEGRDHNGSPIGVCGLTKKMSGVGCKWGRLGGWVLASHILRVVVGWVRIRVPPGLVGKPAPSHGIKCWKCRPQKWPRGEEWSGQEILYCRVGEGDSWESQEREAGRAGA